jgi:squalene-hopene/tetraprenyl-beta-curcumene cyclase
VAVEAMLAGGDDPPLRTALARGISWLVDAVESGRYRESAAIGLYFARLWYYEKLYPMIFVVSALAHAKRRWPAGTMPAPTPPL